MVFPHTQPSNGSGGGDALSTAPRLSRHSHSFVHKKLQKDAKKESDSKLRRLQYGPNTKQQRSLQCLTTFDCPICRLKSTVRVDMNTKERKAVVRCTYCMSLRPRPQELPYPFSTTFVPKLENQADVFFKFNELYRGLVVKMNNSGGEGHNSANVSSEGGEKYGADGVLGGIGARVRESPERTALEEEEEEEEEDGEGREEEEDKEEEKDKDDNTVEDVHAFFANSDDD